MSDLRETKNELYTALKGLAARDWQGRNSQPWLAPKPSYARPDSNAARQGKRADQNGNVRNLKMSDMGSVLTCERIFGASYSGTVLPHTTQQPLYSGKSGTDFHKVIEKALPNWIETEHTPGVSPFVTIPSIGKLTQKEYTGKFKDGITGMIDAYIPKHNAGLELKSVPIGWEFPSEVPDKALGQAAGYAYGLNNYWNKHNRTPERWFWLYLPQDMRTFKAEDPTTYKVFYKEYSELEPLWLDIVSRCINAAKIIDDNGFWNSWDLLACNGGSECFCSN